MVTRRMFQCFCIGILLITGSFVKGDDWPRWRGPSASQISLEKGWNPKALDQPRVLWRTDVGRGHSAFAIQGERLFTTGNRRVIAGSDTLNEELVFCVDAETGEEIWRHCYLSAKGVDYPGPQGTPCIDGDRVYSIGRQGHLFCLDYRDGKILWQRNVLSDSLTQLHAWGLSSSPVIQGDILYLNIGSQGAALDKWTGQILWQSEAEACGYASPVLFEYNGEPWVVMQSGSQLTVRHAISGAVKMTYEWHSYQDVTVLKDQFFLTGGQGGKIKGLAMLNWTEATPSLSWNRPQATAAFQNWVVYGDYAYGFFRPRKTFFQCIDLKTGDLAWETDLGSWGSFSGVDGKLIIATGDGEMLIAEASPEAFKVLSRAQLIQMNNQLRPHRDQVRIWTHPVLANGRLYVRDTDGRLICVDMKAQS